MAATVTADFDMVPDGGGVLDSSFCDGVGVPQKKSYQLWLKRGLKRRPMQICLCFCLDHDFRHVRPGEGNTAADAMLLSFWVSRLSSLGS